MKLPWEGQNWPDVQKKLAREIKQYSDVDKIICDLHPDIERKTIFENLMSNYFDKPKTLTGDQIIEVLKFIQKLAAFGPSAFRAEIGELRAGVENTIVIGRESLAVLLALAFFGAYGEECREFSMLRLIHLGNIFALECIFAYFWRIKNAQPYGEIVVKRAVSGKLPNFAACENLITDVKFTNNNDDEAILNIFPVYRTICKDIFAGNIGQDDLIFFEYPELMVLGLICEDLADSDVICVLGAEHYSSCAIKGIKPVYLGDYNDRFIRCSDGTPARVIVLIDPTLHGGKYEEFTGDFWRDLGKLYKGLSAILPEKLALGAFTSGWQLQDYPCNIQVKFIQHLLAASILEIPLIYNVGDLSRATKESLFEFMQYIAQEQITVDSLYKNYTELAGEIKRDIVNGYNSIKLGEINIFAEIERIAENGQPIKK